MKLLLDENISDRIVPAVSDLFPDSTHVKSMGLTQADDRVIAEWARQGQFTIVSKDTDFYQRAVALGSPPKFIWLRVGKLPNRDDCGSAQKAERDYSGVHRGRNRKRPRFGSCLISDGTDSLLGRPKRGGSWSPEVTRKV